MTNLALNTQNSTPFNTTIITTNNTTISMNSQEISDLVQSRHDNVKTSIERLVSQGVIQCPALQVIKNHQNRDLQVYVFEGEQGKRDTMIIVAQLSPQFLGQVVDRWMELEKAIQQPRLPGNFKEALQFLIEAEEQKEQLALEIAQKQLVIEVQTPKAEVFDAVLDKKRTYSIREFAQHTGVKEKAIKEWIVEKRWATGHDAKTFRPASWSNQHNYMRLMRTGKPFTNAWGYICYNEVIVFTQQGHDEAVRKMVKSGMMKPLATEVVEADNYQLQA
ncbi:hypothetical protein E0H80_16190 [Acinetobacter sp. ANC 4779]|uniref:phage antirepressor KilAC domain-containing protein n=1 Tax=Acinetobacter sp. ANC 4779 TaxID=2529848 RepID=UPI00103F562E|nr:phage antirepressor KilAC domain-containing protein [Acinetobacter sp. ANC 4779]TCB47336.1 hypothetical protein E0H80_16190 [Acinetobacter sp. ANC 4779]